MTEYVLSISYGKDSLACLFAIEQLGWPLDRIIHAEVWATDDIPADPPPMVEFKAKADKIIKERWGIEVEHLCAVRNGEKLTYEKLFYHVPKRKTDGGGNTGFPFTIGPWCNTKLKIRAVGVPIHNRELVQETQRRVLSSASQCCGDNGVPATSNGEFSQSSLAQGAKRNIVQYLGIAADEPERIARHQKPGFMLPLVEIGWDEAYCRQICEENDLLSLLSTRTAQGAAVGSVTTKVSINSVFSARLTLICGRYS